MHLYGNNYMYAGYDNELIEDVTKAINAEYSAIYCYGKLAELAPTQEEKDRILEIRQDEMRHLQIFSNIYMSLTGSQPSPKIIEECPVRYIPGLQFSIKDEQGAVDFYLEIADKAQNPYIKEQFKRAAADEQNHAVWFSYYYTKSCCEK